VDRHPFDAERDPDLDRHQHIKSDPERHQKDADPQHCENVCQVEMGGNVIFVCVQ
jgi:hypothetical protein